MTVVCGSLPQIRLLVLLVAFADNSGNLSRLNHVHVLLLSTPAPSPNPTKTHK
jgi:hypothetical protein